MSRVLTVAGLAVLVACGDSTGPSVPEFAGQWSAVLHITEGQVSGTFHFVENDGNVSGSGSMTIGTTSLAFTVSGVHTHPNVSLTIGTAGFEDMHFSGSFRSDDMVDGNVTGSGFTGERLVFTRQP